MIPTAAFLLGIATTLLVRWCRDYLRREDRAIIQAGWRAAAEDARWRRRMAQRSGPRRGGGDAA